MKCSWCQSRDFPAVHGEDHGEEGCSPAAHGGPWWSRYPPAAWAGPHARAGGGLQEAVTLWETHAGAGSLQDLWPHGERSPHWSRLLAGLVITLYQPVPEALHPMGRTHAGAVHEELPPMGKNHAGAVRGGLCPLGRTPCWSRGRV